MNKKELTVTDIHTLLCLYKITFMTSIESSTTDVWCFDDFDIATILRYLFENLCHVFVCRGSQHVFVCRGCQLCLFLRFFNWIVELFRQCGFFCFSILLYRTRHWHETNKLNHFFAIRTFISYFLDPWLKYIFEL